MKKLNKENVEELLKKQKEHYDNLSPVEKKLLRKEIKDSNNLLEHCRVKTEHGYNYKSNKLDIEKFLFLQEPDLNKPVNKILIRDLARLSRDNIILRYLLIEAGLKDKRIEEILGNTEIEYKKHFYRISNNPQKFYNESFFTIDDELKLSSFGIDFQLSEYGLSKPAVISRKLIEEKIEKILEDESEQFIKRLSSSFKNEIKGLLSYKKVSFTIDDYLQGIKELLLFYFRIVVNNEFNAKNYKYNSTFFISYLNEMYWLNEISLGKALNTFLYLPTYLLTLAEVEKQVASDVSNYSTKIKNVELYL